MTAMTDSLLLSLARYAKSDYRTARENYVTEALVFLLKRSLQTASLLFAKFMKLYLESVDVDEYEAFRIDTQKAFPTADGRVAIPDITITRLNVSHLFVEVKVEAGINLYSINQHEIIDQLEHYNRIATRLDKKTCLLSKYVYRSSRSPALHKRWYDISALLAAYTSSDPVESFLVTELHSYLQEERMSLPRVGYELTKGMEALCNLFQQIELVLEPYDTQKSFTYEWLGYYITKGDRKLAWIGTFYDGDKITLTIENAGIEKRLRQTPSKEFETKDNDGNPWLHATLNLEETGFFCLTAEKQVELLRKWIARKLAPLEA
jgi:hypothetical protein